MPPALSRCRPSPRVHHSSLPPPVVCMCYPRLSPAQSCHHLPPALLLTGNSWIGDTGAQGRWALGPGRCVGAALQCTGVGGITLHPIMLRGGSEAPLTWSNPGKGSSCWRCPPQPHSTGGAWLQGYAGMGAQEGNPSSPWCPQGMQHSLCGTFRKGLSGKETEDSATHQVSVWFTAPSSPVAKSLPEMRQSCL